MRGRCGAVKPDVGGTEPVRGFVRQGTDDPGSGIESELRCCVRIRPGGGPWQGHRNGLRLPAVGLRRGTVEVGGERDVHEVVPQQFGSDDQALLRRQHAAVEAGLDEGQRAECGHTLRPCDGTQDPVVAPEDEAVLLGVVDSRQPCRAAPPGRPRQTAQFGPRHPGGGLHDLHQTRRGGPQCSQLFGRRDQNSGIGAAFVPGHGHLGPKRNRLLGLQRVRQKLIGRRDGLRVADELLCHALLQQGRPVRRCCEPSTANSSPGFAERAACSSSVARCSRSSAARTSCGRTWLTSGTDSRAGSPPCTATPRANGYEQAASPPGEPADTAVPLDRRPGFPAPTLRSAGLPGRDCVVHVPVAHIVDAVTRGSVMELPWKLLSV